MNISETKIKKIKRLDKHGRWRGVFLRDLKISFGEEVVDFITSCSKFVIEFNNVGYKGLLDVISLADNLAEGECFQASLNNLNNRGENELSIIIKGNLFYFMGKRGVLRRVVIAHESYLIKRNIFLANSKGTDILQFDVNLNNIMSYIYNGLSI